jgi:hypothetical protein
MRPIVQHRKRQPQAGGNAPAGIDVSLVTSSKDAVEATIP